MSVTQPTVGWMCTEFGCAHEQRIFLPQATLNVALGRTELPKPIGVKVLVEKSRKNKKFFIGYITTLFADYYKIVLRINVV